MFEEGCTVSALITLERIEDMSINRNILEPHPDQIYRGSNQLIEPAIEIPLRRSQRLKGHVLVDD